MKEIIIKKENAAKIEAALAQANGRSRERLISTYAEVEKIANRIETKIRERYGISRKAFDGSEINVIEGAQRFPSAYRYRPMGTSITIRYHAGSYRLVGASRDDANRAKEVEINLSDAAKAAIVAAVEDLDNTVHVVPFKEIRRDYHCFNKIILKCRDYTEVDYETADSTGTIVFNRDSAQSAYFVTSPATIGGHYRHVAEASGWILIGGKKIVAPRIDVYRAGDYGCIIYAPDGKIER